jgi:uncharacterized membrane protein YphA (DoxX/SURF4 family)
MSVWKCVLLVFGMLCWVAAISIAAITTVAFIGEEMTQGAFIKRFWPEVIMETVLFAVGYIMIATEK